MLIGLAVHMTVASVFGTAIAALAQRLPATRSMVIAGGILFAAVVWPVMQWGVWYKIDEVAAQGLTDWIFAVAHLIFGLLAAGMASIGVADDDGARRGRHAAGHGLLKQPQPVPGSLFPAGSSAVTLMGLAFAGLPGRPCARLSCHGHDRGSLVALGRY